MDKWSYSTRLLVLACYLAALFYFALRPNSGSGDGYTLHFIAFLVLMLLMAFVGLRLFTAAAICLGIGVAIEFIQLSIPSRSFSGWDMAADAAGIVTAIAMLIVWKEVSHERQCAHPRKRRGHVR